jgi:hypothetical protein
MFTRSGRLGFALALSVSSFMLGCGTSGEVHAPVNCGGEERVQINCESEFSYEGTNIEGGFSAAGLGSLNAKTEEAALRQIDQQTEQYSAQAKRLCEEYNACVLDKATYGTRSENLRRRISKVPELYDGLKAAPDDDTRRKALAAAYQELVPDDQRRELALSLRVNAKRPGETNSTVIGPGTSLPTDTRISFSVEVTHPAYVYFFQKGPDGALNVLFPDARIAVKNPIAAGTELRIPAGEATFRLNEKDVGTERVYVVASLEPLDSIAQAAERVAAGNQPDGQLASVSSIPANSGDCKQRALELDEGAPKCVRSRGLELDEAPASQEKVSLRARTEAADSVLVQVFGFEHTP